MNLAHLVEPASRFRDARSHGGDLMNALAGHRLRASSIVAAIGVLVGTVAVPASASAASATPTVTISASAGTILWGTTATLTIHLAVASGSGISVVDRPLHIQSAASNSSSAFLTLPEVGNVMTDAAGNATLRYEPGRNLWYRATFDGATDLAAATSTPVRVLVEQRATISPDNRGKVKSITKGTQVSFTTRVQPVFDDVPHGHVLWQVWGTRKGTFEVLATALSDPNTVGIASMVTDFNQVGQYAVRSRALGTSTDVTSAWTSLQHYDVK
jgi:hypothetical protein